MSAERNEVNKQKLAYALKSCMGTSLLENITVRDICLKSGLSRQTFYRLFMDKYDLMNWYFDQLLNQSFEKMGSGETIFDGLVRKFDYIRQERLFFLTGFRYDEQNNLRDHDFEKILSFYKDLIFSKTGSVPDERINKILEMYCQSSVYMTVKWVLNGMHESSEELASIMLDAMPSRLESFFRKLSILK